ncbi:helix-turn-helix domain-containing protein [Cognataquiflexum rubidum]|uniref:helix-turn-helix domain-containing protein n=1 Tax=Cognataquiflexum rubidum TaxID=2922273 RepID=UPI001F145C60|nr:helix-turn-helix domain-containing protein [Cognataquiflexum rubidum]MCH6234958.1 helix-turn-helix domain-containing protein [Cognataquiflexum rubidum]
MIYKKYPPALDLMPYLDCLFIWERDSSEPLVVQSPPSGFNALVFNYSDPYWAYQNETQKEKVPIAFVSGQFTANYHLEVNGKIGIIGVVLKASSLYNFFGLNMVSLVNKRLDLLDALGENTNGIFDSVKNASTAEERIKLIQDFLLSHLEAARSRQSIIDDTISFIDQNNGMVTIEEVLVKFKISRRYLEKRFLEKVGISPKLYSRIKRFGNLSNKVAHTNEIDWQDLVFESGFHDQSHLAKDYKAFNQMNPSDYHQKHRELIRFIDK